MSIEMYTGEVAVVNGNEIADKFSDVADAVVTLWSFKIEDNDTWFQSGRGKPRFNQGDTIKFVADGSKVELKNVEVLQSAPQQESAGAVEQPTPTQTSASKGGTSLAKGSPATRDNYWKAKEERDLEKDARYQAVDIPRMTMSSAISSAAYVVDAAIKNEALGFGTTAKSKRLDMLGDFVIELAEKFYDRIVTAEVYNRSREEDAALDEVGVTTSSKVVAEDGE